MRSRACETPRCTTNRNMPGAHKVDNKKRYGHLNRIPTIRRNGRNGERWENVKEWTTRVLREAGYHHLPPLSKIRAANPKLGEDIDTFAYIHKTANRQTNIR